MSISIIIPTLNEEKYIGKTLKQFLSFKEKYDMELIVSDGKSDDRTVGIAKKYADKVVLCKKTKRNISEGRNAGAKVAKGDILIFIDADIRVANPNHFFQTVIGSFKDPAIVAATVPIYIYPEEETFADKFFHAIFNRIVVFSNKYGLGGGRGECQIIKKNKFKDVKGYNKKLVVAEDFDLFKRLKKEGKIVYLKNLKIYESPRRFRKDGYSRVLFLYTLNFIAISLFGKSFSKEWEPVR